MSVALSTAWMDAADRTRTPAHDRWAMQAKALGVRAVLAHRAPARSVATGAALRAGGISVVGLTVSAADREDLQALSERAAGLRASVVVVEGGAQQPSREEAAEALLRALYPLQAAGVPLAVRNAATEEDLLDLEGVAWILDELPTVGLVFDAARVESIDPWLDAYAGRMVAVVTTGLRGGHPEEAPLDWGTLTARAPKRAPWIFDPVADLATDAVEDSLRALRAWHPGTGGS